MKGKNASAQELTIRLLNMLDPLDRRGVVCHAAKQLVSQKDALAQLNLCTMMASELAQDPHKYSDFLLLAKTILARQKGCDPESVTKKEVGKAMDMHPTSAGNLLDRITDYARELKPQEIIRLCEGFDEQSNRLFWENQIYLCFHDLLRAPDVTDGPVLACLDAVWNSLSEQEQDLATDLFPSHSVWFQQLNRAQEPESPQTGLYEFLDSARKRANVTLTRIYDELAIDPDTYASYKKAWLKFEQNGCTGPYPSRRLSRQRLLYLAVYLEMDFYAAVGMLATAGYDFHSVKGDHIVTGYLLDRRHSRQDALNKLHPQLR